MVKSMTGFGKGEAALQNKKITVEIRSLNSKQLDLGLRLPAVYRQSEYEIRNIIARTIQRGKVDVFVTVESQAVETPARINKEVFREYLRQMTDTLAFAGIDADYDAIVPVIMRLPEVVSTETESISDEEHAALIAATEAAAARLDAFRMQEGAILIADLLGRVDRIESYKEEVVPFEKARTETIKARILDNLEKLQADVDRNRLEQEMIFYLEKLDITEEKVRLANHCRYFREVAAGEEGAGRKLGFIAQDQGTGTEHIIMGKVVIFSAPSGSGKTTIVRELLKRFPQFEFSVSATSRAPRGCERHGCDYHFMTHEEFMQAVAENRFVEWEEVYKGTCYGTLRSEVERIWAKGNIIVFDVDVIGGINLKRIFGGDACSIFVMPPSVEELRRRLEGRGTDAPEVIDRRVAKAEFELTKAPEFDHIVVNDSLDEAIAETTRIIDEFITGRS